MKRILLLSLLLVSTSALAQAVLNEEAYEVSPAHIALPSGAAGSVILRECANCESHTLRVTAKTRYLLNCASTTLANLKSRLPQAKAADGLYVVAYDIATGHVTWIALDI